MKKVFLLFLSVILMSGCNFTGKNGGNESEEFNIEDLYDDDDFSSSDEDDEFYYDFTHSVKFTMIKAGTNAVYTAYFWPMDGIKIYKGDDASGRCELQAGILRSELNTAYTTDKYKVIDYVIKGSGSIVPIRGNMTISPPGFEIPGKLILNYYWDTEANVDVRESYTITDYMLLYD